jgi:hypothetical protein
VDDYRLAPVVPALVNPYRDLGVFDVDQIGGAVTIDIPDKDPAWIVAGGEPWAVSH